MTPLYPPQAARMIWYAVLGYIARGDYAAAENIMANHDNIDWTQERAAIAQVRERRAA